MDLELNGKVALVTGSSRGLGEAVALGLAGEGATVVVHGRDRAKTEGVARRIAEQGGRAHVVLADLTRDDEVARLVAEASDLAGPIAIVVNNAGGSGPAADWADTTAAAWAASFDRNVLAAVRVTTRLLPAMRRARWGRVINIASMAGLLPPATQADYAAAKAAMVAMTSSLAKAVAAEGITVNTISPGAIHSDRLDQAFRQAASAHGVPADAPWSEVEAAALPRFATVPLGRVGTPLEIADAVAFLASPRAGYITGTNLRFDGGMWPGL